MFPEDILHVIFLVGLQELQELIIKDGKGGFGTFCDQGMLHLQVSDCIYILNMYKVVMESGRKWWHLLFSTVIITVTNLVFNLQEFIPRIETLEFSNQQRLGEIPIF